jgi:hypothetical protein
VPFVFAVPFALAFAVPFVFVDAAVPFAFASDVELPLPVSGRVVVSPSELVPRAEQPARRVAAVVPSSPSVARLEGGIRSSIGHAY